MGKGALSLLILFLSFTSETLLVVRGQLQKTWCVAKPSSDQATLLANLNYACSQVDCQILQIGRPCSSPESLINRASVAMNLYYHSKGRNRWNCDFRNFALIALTDPSKYFGNSSLSFHIIDPIGTNKVMVIAFTLDPNFPRKCMCS